MVVIHRPGRAMLVPVQRRRRRWVAGAAIAMQGAGLPEHAIARALRLSRVRLTAILGDRRRLRLVALSALVAAEMKREMAS